MPPLQISNKSKVVASVFLLGLVTALGVFVSQPTDLAIDTKLVDDTELLVPIEIVEPTELIEPSFIESFDLFYEIDSYSLSESGPTFTVSAELEEIHNMNAYRGMPANNMLKMHDTCYDEDIDQGYAVGIMSSTVAVLQNDEVIEYLETDISIGDFELKTLECGGGILFVSSDEIIKIYDGNELTLINTLEPSEGLFNQALKFYPDGDWFSFPSGDNKFIYEASTLRKLVSQEARISETIELENGNKLSISTGPIARNQGYEIITYDQDFKEISSQILGEDHGHMDSAVYDPINERIWFLNYQAEKLLVYDLKNNQLLDTLRTPNDPKRLLYGAGFVVVLTENGFDYEGYGDFLGGVEVYDAGSVSSLYSLELPSHHTNMDMDEDTGTLFVTNNGDNSLSKVDLASGSYEVLSMGSSTEGAVVLPNGELLVRSRLGGSRLFQFDPDDAENTFTRTDTLFPWPMGIDYSETLKVALTFDFLASSVSLYNPESHAFENTYESSLEDGATDGVGHMTYDHTRDLAYISLPQRNAVSAISIATGEEIAVIELEDFPTDSYAGLSGPANLVLGTHEPSMMLFVFVKENQTLYAYDGLNDFALKESIVIEKNAGVQDYPYSLFVNQNDDQVFIGEQIFDAYSLEKLGTLEYGDALVAMDAESGLLMSVGYDQRKNEETLFIMNKEGAHLDELTLDSDQYVNARFTYDEVNKKIYVMYMVDSEIWEINLQ
jgi:hypothetical protein